MPSLSFFILNMSVLAQLLIHFYILGNIFKSAIVCKKVNGIQTEGNLGAFENEVKVSLSFGCIKIFSFCGYNNLLLGSQ